MKSKMFSPGTCCSSSQQTWELQLTVTFCCHSRMLQCVEVESHFFFLFWYLRSVPASISHVLLPKMTCPSLRVQFIDGDPSFSGTTNSSLQNRRLICEGWWSFILRLTHLCSHIFFGFWMNVTKNHPFSTLTHTSPCVCFFLSIFLCSSSFSLSPLPLAFRS